MCVRGAEAWGLNETGRPLCEKGSSRALKTEYLCRPAQQAVSRCFSAPGG